MEKELVKVYVYERDGKYECSLEDKKYNPDSELDLYKIRKSLVLPYEIVFNCCPKSVIKYVLKRLCDEFVDISIEHVDVLKTIRVKVSEKQYVVGVYLISYKENMYDRVYDPNPYIYTDINDKKVLMEVTKDYARNHDGDYYFLDKDLSADEQVFFSSSYKELKVDYLHKLEDYDKKKHPKKRKLNFRRKI